MTYGKHKNECWLSRQRSPKRIHCRPHCVRFYTPAMTAKAAAPTPGVIYVGPPSTAPTPAPSTAAPSKTPTSGSNPFQLTSEDEAEGNRLSTPPSVIDTPNKAKKEAKALLDDNFELDDNFKIDDSTDSSTTQKQKQKQKQLQVQEKMTVPPRVTRKRKPQAIAHSCQGQLALDCPGPYGDLNGPIYDICVSMHPRTKALCKHHKRQVDLHCWGEANSQNQRPESAHLYGHQFASTFESHDGHKL